MGPLSPWLLSLRIMFMSFRRDAARSSRSLAITAVPQPFVNYATGDGLSAIY